MGGQGAAGGAPGDCQGRWREARGGAPPRRPPPDPAAWRTAPRAPAPAPPPPAAPPPPQLAGSLRAPRSLPPPPSQSHSAAGQARCRPRPLPLTAATTITVAQCRAGQVRATLPATHRRLLRRCCRMLAAPGLGACSTAASLRCRGRLLRRQLRGAVLAPSRGAPSPHPHAQLQYDQPQRAAATEKQGVLVPAGSHATSSRAATGPPLP